MIASATGKRSARGDGRTENYGNLGMVKGIAAGGSAGDDAHGDDQQAEGHHGRPHSAHTGDERRSRGNR